MPRKAIKPHIYAQVLKRDSHKCQECGHEGQVGQKLGCIQIHQIVPERPDAGEAMDNLIVLCVKCLKKRVRPRWLLSMRYFQTEMGYQWTER
jgi:5-methylcytosine-specific restriction endonuclease McrA